MLSYEERLDRIGRLTAPAIRQGIAELDLKPGMTGLDAGCGIGRHACMLARAVQPGGKVIGLDISDKFLDIARSSEEARALGDAVEFKQGSILDLPFDENSFDFLWCSDCLYAGPGLPIQDPMVALKELAQVVKPGGQIAVVFWSGQSLFPGYPQLETRLFSAFSASAPYLSGPPEHHFMKAAGWLMEAGFESRTARSYIAQATSPLSTEERESLDAVFGMFIEMFQGYVSREELEEVNDLCCPESDRYILNRPDYTCYVVYTVFSGIKG